VIGCNEWKTEKRHECANMGKVKRLESRWQLYRTSFPVRDLENFRTMDFLLDRVYNPDDGDRRLSEVLVPLFHMTRRRAQEYWHLQHHYGHLKSRTAK